MGLAEYQWIVVVGALACGVMAYGIGANDVANQFGSSVGSKAISLKWAVVLAAVFEFIGAVAFGGAVTDTVRSKIVDFDVFTDNPGVLMFGMMSALIGAGVWLLLASKFGLPVSTTHSIIGAIIGFALSTGQAGAVQWDEVGLIVASWFASPIMSGVVAAALFLVIRATVLTKPNSTARAYWLLPVFLWGVFATFSVYLLFKNKGSLAGVSCWQKGSDGNELKEPCSIKKWSQGNPGEAVGIAIGASLLVALLLTPALWWYANRFLADFDANTAKEAKRQAQNTRDAELSDDKPDSSNPNNVAPVEQLDDVAPPHAVEPQLEPMEVHSKAIDDDVAQAKPDPVALHSAMEVAGGHAAAAYPERDEFSVSPRSKAIDEIHEDIVIAVAQADIHPGAHDNSQNFDSERTMSTAKDLRTGFRGAWDRLALNQDIHQEALDEDDRAAAIHADTENFDPRTERFFAMCQVLSAIFDCIGHGSNDTANAVAPFAAILGLFEAGMVVSKVETPVWVLAYGGVCIAIGLALYGYHVIKSIGMKLARITPSRGFSIELGAAWIIIIGSNLGIPLSTTHCQVGATVGVGLTERQGGRMCQCRGGGSVNWKLLYSVFGAWVFTLVFAGMVTAMIFSFGAYAPFVVRGDLPATGF